MSDTEEIYAELFKLASQSAEVQQVTKLAAELRKTAMNPWIGAGLGSLAAVGIPMAYRRGTEAAEEEAQKNKNLAFIAGLASGVIGPHLLKGVSKAVGYGATPGSISEEDIVI